MKFLALYSRSEAMRALEEALQGRAIPVRDYNQIVAFLAGARDYTNDPRRFQQRGTDRMAWPLIYPQSFWDNRLAPIVGVSEPLPTVVSQGQTAYTSLAFRSSALSDAIGHLLRSMRFHTAFSQEGATVPALSPDTPDMGPIAIKGEAAAAVWDETAVDPNLLLVLDRRMAQNIQTVTRAIVPLSRRVSDWVRTDHLDAPTAQENSAIEASLWMAEQYRREFVRTSAVAGAALIAVAILSAGLGGMFDRFRSPSTASTGDKTDGSKTQSILASQPRKLVGTNLFGDPATGFHSGLGVLG